MKRLIAAVTVGGAVVMGAATLGIAGAAYASTPTVAASSTHNSGTVATWVRAHHRALRRAVVTISANSIGVTPQDLVSELRSGKSIAAVADEHSVPVQNVVNALVSAAQSRVDRAEQHNRLNAATASRLTTALPRYATKLVNRTF